jgi:hypothetical protein
MSLQCQNVWKFYFASTAAFSSLAVAFTTRESVERGLCNIFSIKGRSTIARSVMSPQDKVVESLLAGANGYLSKSICATYLLDILRRAWHGEASSLHS